MQTIEIDIDDEEKAKVSVELEKLGLTLAEYIRQSIGFVLYTKRIPFVRELNEINFKCQYY
jgi:antitoxin component of RelBE/YafQ-DinJ toxin-antitoxin module